MRRGPPIKRDPTPFQVIKMRVHFLEGVSHSKGGRTSQRREHFTEEGVLKMRAYLPEKSALASGGSSKYEGAISREGNNFRKRVH
jgi:hypothetical protein